MPRYGHGKSGYLRDLHATKGKATSKAIIYKGDFSDAEDVKHTCNCVGGAKGRPATGHKH